MFRSVRTFNLSLTEVLDVSDTTNAPPYEPDREYDLKVAFVAWDGPFKYLPRHTVVAKGALLNRLIEENGPDVIRSADLRE